MALWPVAGGSTPSGSALWLPCVWVWGVWGGDACVRGGGACECVYMRHKCVTVICLSVLCNNNFFFIAVDVVLVRCGISTLSSLLFICPGSAPDCWHRLSHIGSDTGNHDNGQTNSLHKIAALI